jgi:putative protease
LVELLAPAGSREALIAAVESGANAVYLAGSMFGARAYASNFDEEGMRAAIRFAHLRGVLINVTVNTIVGDEELPALRDYLKFLYEAGADAVLVQDLGVARIARETVPKLPLHASTQMTVHSLEGVLALQELGFSRVVLSRELSLKEIRYICSHCQVEIEVFMHGALCVCYSGQCLMSSVIGGRSGNRGRCAQPCRLPYDLVDENGCDLLEDRAGEYLLSPKDINTIEIIPELIEAGVASLKIEGRMKRPEYVATVVSTYREAIDRHYTGTGYFVTSQEKDNLAQIFNRDFTTAYLLDRPGKDMMSDRRPNNRGLMVGRVENYDRNSSMVTVKLSGPLFLGDQVDFWVKVGGRVTAEVKELWHVNGQSIAGGQAGELVKFYLPKAVHAHDRLFKVYDAALMEKAKESYKSGAPIRRIGLKAEVWVSEGQPLKIVFRDADGYEASAVTDFVAEAALKRPLSEEVIRKQVDRLGSSIFVLQELVCHIEGAVMVPMSEINEARRKATEALEQQRLADLPPCNYPPMKGKEIWPARKENVQLPKSQLMAAVDSLEQMAAAIEGGADGILLGEKVIIIRH